MKVFASLTNSGCESRMAEFDVIVYSGGSVPVSKISNKQKTSTSYKKISTKQKNIRRVHMG